MKIKVELKDLTVNDLYDLLVDVINEIITQELEYNLQLNEHYLQLFKENENESN